MNWVLTLMLSIIVGQLGVDRFMTGQIGLGILKLITAGGCGMTHALSSLMHGHFTAAIHYNVLVIPVFLIILYLIISSLIEITRSK